MLVPGLFVELRIVDAVFTCIGQWVTSYSGHTASTEGGYESWKSGLCTRCEVD